MDHKQIINQRQLAWLTASIISSGGILSLQNAIIRLSEMDAWMSYLLPIVYLFIVAAFFAYLAKRFPQKHIFEISMLLLGRGGGTCLNIVLLFHFWMISMRDISSLSKFTTTVLLERTPLEILILLPCLVLFYYGRTSVEVIARVNDVFYPLFVISIVLMPLLLLNEITIGLLRPMLTTSPLHIADGNFITFGGVGDIFVLGAFMHTLYNSNQLRSSIRHGSLLGMGILTLITLMEIMVLGPKMPGNFLYPPYHLVQMIHITDFMDRMDLFMLIIWFPTLACKIVVVYLALLIGISSLQKQRNYPIFNKPTALLIAITTLLSFRSTTELFAFANFGAPVIMLCYQPLAMLLLIIACKFRKQNHPLYQENGKEKPSTRSSNGLPYRGWINFSNGLLAAAGMLAIIGLAWGRYFPYFRISCTIGYMLCIALLVWTTHREIKKLMQIEKMKNAPAASADTSM